VNNIAGLGVLNGKKDSILNWIDNNKIDVFLVQEASVSFRHPRIKSYLKSKKVNKYHISTSESEWKFEGTQKPGGILCILSARLKSRVLRRMNDHLGRWCGTDYVE
jgi:hypothetical protein